MLAGPAGAQAPDPPCAPGVAPSATIRGFDVEDRGGPLTATHTIRVGLDVPGYPIGEFEMTLPPGVQTVPNDDLQALFRTDTPGPVPVTVSWRHAEADSITACTASATTTLDIGPARPLRVVGPRLQRAPRPFRRFKIALEWRLPLGEDADLRPIEMRVRGVRRARRPGAAAPGQTLTFALRESDRGFAVNDNPERMLRSAGWSFAAGYGGRNADPLITMRDYPWRGRRRSFGLELELTQAGRLLVRTQAVGRCQVRGCNWRQR